MKALSDSSGNVIIRINTGSGTPAASSVVCLPDNSVETENTQNAQVASLIIGGFAAVAFVLAITARYRGRL